MNRYDFTQDKILKERFPKCKICNSNLVTGHECPGPKRPSYQERETSPDIPETPFQQIWHNANEQMLEEEHPEDYRFDDWEP